MAPREGATAASVMRANRNRWNLPDLGLGLGLRTQHFGHVLEHQPPVDWFEIVSENFMNTGGRPLQVLERVAERYPIVMHGVSLSIGSTDPLDFAYLRELRALSERCKAVWLGDHVCWTGVAGRNNHDLLPLPYDEATLAHLVERVRAVQDFLARLAEEADCALLLDVNNVHVSCRNHGWDPEAYLAAIPYERVVQIHLAGHTDKGTHCIDTHTGHTLDAVWKLYAEAMRRAGTIATMVEWDHDIPEFDVVHAEVLRAREFRSEQPAELPAELPAEVRARG